MVALLVSLRFFWFLEVVALTTIDVFLRSEAIQVLIMSFGA